MTPVWVWTGHEATRQSVQDAVCRGWRPLVGRLYDSLLAAGWDGRLVQVKEKFGGLRFYVEREPLEVRRLIYAAMDESERTCEVCGETGEPVTRASGWRNTLCALHASDPRPAWEQAGDYA